MKSKIIIILCTIALGLITSACGLHLRGVQENKVDKYTSIRLVGSPSSRLYQLLYAKLKTLGIPMVEVAKPGTVSITFVGPNIKSTLAAVDSRSQEVEYSMSSKTIYYFIMFGDKEKPLKRISGFTRGLFNKNNEVLASAHEGEVIRDELIQQTAEDIYTQFLRQ